MEDKSIAATKRVRRNEELECDEVRVIDSRGEQAGVMSLNEAIKMAKDEELDLVEVSPNASPPVCRIMDFGKHLFSLNKKGQNAKKKTKRTQVKEIKFRPTTDTGDYNIKLRKLKEFLENGDKVKVTLRFRGREMVHQDRGEVLLERIKIETDEFAKVELLPKFEGRQMVMVLAPK